MKKSKRIREALKEIGIHTAEDLNKAIKKEKPLNLGLMTERVAKERKAG